MIRTLLVLNSRRLQDSMHVEWSIERAVEILKQNIDVDEAIITFDQYGVSGHTNHKSCFHAVKQLALDHECYQLKSFNIFTKYLGIFTFIVDKALFNKQDDLYVITPLQLMNNVYGAMQQHRSQLLWFRYLYLIASKYVFINCMERIKPI
mgnify:CR=1 FL=1